MYNYYTHFKDGSDLGDAVSAYEWKFALEIEDQMRFWHDVGMCDIERIKNKIRWKLEETMQNYASKFEFQEGNCDVW